MLSPRVSSPRPSRLAVCPSPKKASASPKVPRPQRPPGSKVRIVSRVRPLLPNEIDRELQSCISIRKDEHALDVKDEKNNQIESFKLDCCYGESDDLAPIFKAEVEPLLPLLFCGCNATAFAYGATGSGKTYTMQGGEGRPGLMVLAMAQIFTLAEHHPTSRIEVSYYELYMERCYDLLKHKSREISVLEDSEGRVQLRGLTQIEVRSLSEFEDLLEKTSSQRKKMISGSNRSHSVLMVTITSGEEAKLPGKLSLIDLAGNEDNRKAATDGIRLAESNRINQSLFVLSNVINALNANERRVPYRDSKLTRILQDSLSGASCTLMIACLSPGSCSEATQTLLSLLRKSRQLENTGTPSHDTKRKSLVISPSKVSSPLQNRLSLPSKSPSRFGPAQQRTLTKRASFEPLATPRDTRDTNIFSIGENMPILENSSQDTSRDEDINSVEVLSLTAQDAHGFLEAQDACSPTNAGDTGDQVAVYTPAERPLEPSSSPPLSSMLRNLGSSLREALSPLPSNCVVVRNLDSTPGYSETQTPSANTLCIKDLDADWTAVERFDCSSRDLQGALLKEYLDILNTGTREDLLSLKGIGNKRADSIMRLREESESPFTQLRDLKKIGLSAKQAEKLFQVNVVRQVLSNC